MGSPVVPEMEISGVPLIVAGLLLVVFGRRLFWLLVGSAGFLVGFSLAQRFVETGSDTSALIAGLVLGIAGALLTLFAQKIAIVIGGFIAGGYAAMTVLSNAGFIGGLPVWVPFLAGGIVGALMLRQVFEWTLIVLTSLVGAIMIFQGIAVGGSVSLPLTLLFAAIGVAIQARFRKKR